MIQTSGWIHWIRNEEVQSLGERDLQLQFMLLEAAVHRLEANQGLSNGYDKFLSWSSF